LTAAGCGKPADDAPAQGTISVQLSRSRVALGSPVDVTYKFTVAGDVELADATDDAATHTVAIERGRNRQRHRERSVAEVAETVTAAAQDMFVGKPEF
jgi:hypothetical protein